MTTITRLNTNIKMIGLAGWLLTAASIAAAQAPPSEDVGKLIATLNEEGLTTLRKNRLVGNVYSGTVEVWDVEEAGTAAKPAVRIKVNLAASRFYLAFETTEVDKAERIKKGDKVSLSGKLVRFEVHRSGYINVPSTEWAVFQQVSFQNR